jgi:hypothetical protein
MMGYSRLEAFRDGGLVVLIQPAGAGWVAAIAAERCAVVDLDQHRLESSSPHRPCLQAGHQPRPGLEGKALALSLHGGSWHRFAKHCCRPVPRLGGGPDVAGG